MDTNEKTLPVYELIYNKDDSTEGLFNLSWVDEPAILEKWKLFSKEKFTLDFKVTNQDEMIISGPALISGMRIYRADKKMGQYYCFFSEITIKDLVVNYFEKGNINSFNVMHNSKDKVREDQAFMIESWFVGSKMDKSRELGFNLPKGSWMVSLKVTDTELWAKLKAGELQGFSVEVVSDADLHFAKNKVCPVTTEMVQIAKLRKTILENDLERFVKELNGKAVIEYWNKQCKCSRCRELKSMGYCLTGILPEFGQWKKVHKIIEQK